jgi:hypothetical protein
MPPVDMRSVRNVFMPDYAVLVLSIVVLSCGVLLYVLVRPEDSAFFLSLIPKVPNLLSAREIARLTGWFPSFFHVLGFSLATWGLLGCRHILFACTSWCVINVYFEFSQLTTHSSWILSSYIRYSGVFDPMDIIGCFAGGFTAWIVSRFLFAPYKTKIGR